MFNPFSDTAEGAVKGLGAAIKDAVGAFKANPEKVLEFDAAVEQAVLSFQSNAIAAINATMQAEAKSEHWLQWSWRPMFGYTAASILINNHILLPYLAKLGVVPLAVTAEEWLMITAVLGVSAYVRGRDK